MNKTKKNGKKSVTHSRYFLITVSLDVGRADWAMIKKTFFE